MKEARIAHIHRHTGMTVTVAVVDLWGGQRAVVLEYACVPDDATLLADAAARTGVAPALLRLCARRSAGHEVFARVEPAQTGLCGGKQGAFGQNLRREGEAMRRTRNFDACRTLDGRRVGQVLRERRLVAWAVREAGRRAAAQERSAQQRAEHAAAEQHAADALVASVQRDAAATMAAAVAAGLRARSEDAAAAAADPAAQAPEPAPKRARDAWEAWDEDLFDWDGSEEDDNETAEDGTNTPASSGKDDYKGEESAGKSDKEGEGEEENADKEEMEEEEETAETERLRAAAVAEGRVTHEHALVAVAEPYGAERVWVCDVCGKRGRRARVHHCAECSFDLCAACFDALSK